MSALLFVPGLGHATTCITTRHVHRPLPLRFVWHHVLPQSCGGATEPANLAQLCDNCHYAVHALMTTLLDRAGATNTGKLDGKALAGLLTRGTRAQRRLAVAGYIAAVNLGTAARIPNEGGHAAA